MLRLKRRAALAGIAACSPHDLRRTELLDAGADIASVQRLARHATRYDPAGNAPAAAAASSTRWLTAILDYRGPVALRGVGAAATRSWARPPRQRRPTHGAIGRCTDGW